jgi:hypothetical protein
MNERQLLERIGTLAEHHPDLSFRAELRDHVRALVHRPYVVVLVDAHGVGERHAVAARAELLHEVAALVELEQPRLTAPGVHEHVAFRVGRDPDAFALAGAAVPPCVKAGPAWSSKPLKTTPVLKRRMFLLRWPSRKN